MDVTGAARGSRELSQISHVSWPPLLEPAEQVTIRNLTVRASDPPDTAFFFLSNMLANCAEMVESCVTRKEVLNLNLSG